MSVNMFDILGPITVGPSSSHTAGAIRIGLACRIILGEDVKKAKVTFYGSLPTPTADTALTRPLSAVCSALTRTMSRCVTAFSSPSCAAWNTSSPRRKSRAFTPIQCASRRRGALKASICAAFQWAAAPFGLSSLTALPSTRPVFTTRWSSFTRTRRGHWLAWRRRCQAVATTSATCAFPATDVTETSSPLLRPTCRSTRKPSLRFRRFTTSKAWSPYPNFKDRRTGL